MNVAARGLAAFDASLARPDTLGTRLRDGGTNFAVYSEHAHRVELCLFEPSGRTEIARLALPEMEGGIWYGFLPGITEGQRYGYRVHGPYAPADGHRFNPAKLLIDPYASELHERLTWDDAVFGYVVGQDDLSLDERDSAPYVPKGVVAARDYEWEEDAALNRRWEDTVIYEAHVKGLTAQHDGVVKAHRGTFAGLASDPVLEHLTRLGITAIELLPIHAFLDDRHLLERGLSNYWGYNTLSFFAPHQAYLANGEASEVKAAVKRFHAAGIEVILDVVYNHTCEGNELGPTLSFRGLDNASYYVLSPENPRHCFDTTGCGNTLNIAHPMVLRMVMDSLRYWVEVMHVDGFRFDLASTLARGAEGFEWDSTFFAAIRQDPVLSSVKLIAEPWDIGDGGYQVGGFPWPFREWNDKARDDIRAFWRRDPGLVGAMSERLTGSPVQFEHAHRPATSSINFVAAHDGFTLWDTVSYSEKHNDANGEGGADGHDHNLSDNLGHEGPTDDPGILEARHRRAAAMLATLAVAQGVPMILAGDEFGNSQDGNNNAYCQDNTLAWLDWSTADARLMDVVCRALALRRDIPGLVDAKFATCEARDGQPLVKWLHPSGRDMVDEDWNDMRLRCFGQHRTTSREAEILILLNAGDEAQFILPDGRWSLAFDSSDAATEIMGQTLSGTLSVPWQSLIVLRPTD
ncbi:MAG: glycogen debranching protein GlgX [Paracoccaceae bacterium]